MTLRLVFSESARRDRREIMAYSVEHYGTGQARKLRRYFKNVLIALTENPEMGRRRTELDPSGHSFRYFVVMRIFIIVYRPMEDRIEVVRILHSARNLVN